MSENYTCVFFPGLGAEPVLGPWLLTKKYLGRNKQFRLQLKRRLILYLYRHHFVFTKWSLIGVHGLKSAELSDELVRVRRLSNLRPRLTVQAFNSDASRPHPSDHCFQARCIESSIYRVLESSQIEKFVL